MSTGRTAAPTAGDSTYCCLNLNSGSCGCPYANCANMSDIANENKSFCESFGYDYCDTITPSNSSCTWSPSCTMTAPTSTACSVTSPII